MKLQIGVYSHSHEPRIRDVDGADLVELALSQSSTLCSGELESMRNKIERLSAIVGRLIDKLPESERLSVVQLYDVKAVE